MEVVNSNNDWGWKQSDSSEEPIDISILAIGEIIDNTYKVIKVLGKGDFGRVYHVKHLDSGVEYALKMPLGAEPKELDNELKCFNAVMPHSIKVVNVRGTVGFIMELRGKSLHEYIIGRIAYLEGHKKGGKVIHSSEICLMAITLLNQLQRLHELGWIHRDIKTSNILFGCTAKDSDRIYLVDFGVAEQYLDNNGMHRSGSKAPSDDLASLACMLLYFHNIKLPKHWGKINVDSSKEATEVFKEFLISAYQLRHGDKPDYDSYRLAFEKEYNRIIEDDPEAPRLLGQSPVLVNEDWSHEIPLNLADVEITDESDCDEDEFSSDAESENMFDYYND